MKKMTALILVISMLLTVGMHVSAASFIDVGDEFSWAAESIDKFCAEGIIIGKSEKIFAPDDNITRAEFAKMLSLCFDLNKQESAVYSDVSADSWAYEYIAAACKYTVAANVLDVSCTADIYMPDTAATRQEIAAALANVIGIDGDTDESYLKDNFIDSDDVNDTIYNLVQNVAAAGLILGYEDNTLLPSGNVTRAEAAVLLDRAREYKKANPLPEQTGNPEPSPSAAPEPTDEPSPSPSSIPANESVGLPAASVDIVIVDEVSQAAFNGERYYEIKYIFGGAVCDTPLVVSEDAAISGIRSTIDEIECGDFIVFNKNAKGISTALKVVFAPREAYEKQLDDAPLSKIIDISGLNNWGFYDSNAVTKIYYGRLDSLKKSDSGAVLRLDYGNSVDQSIFIPNEGVRVCRYNIYKNSIKQRYEKLEIYDLYNENEAYAFVKEKRGVVSDVIIIDYTF